MNKIVSTIFNSHNFLISWFDRKNLKVKILWYDSYHYTVIYVDKWIYIQNNYEYLSIYAFVMFVQIRLVKYIVLQRVGLNVSSPTWPIFCKVYRPILRVHYLQIVRHNPHAIIRNSITKYSDVYSFLDFFQFFLRFSHKLWILTKGIGFTKDYNCLVLT